MLTSPTISHSLARNKMPDLIIELLEDSGLLIDGASETVKYEIKTQEGGFLSAVIAPMTALMI